MQVVHLTECHQENAHEVKEVDLLPQRRLDTTAIGKILNDLSDFVVVDVVVRDGVPYLGVDDLSLNGVPTVVEVLELFRNRLCRELLK